jgi:hypothetical protein
MADDAATAAAAAAPEDDDDDDDDCDVSIGGAGAVDVGGLFSVSNLTLSICSIFKSGFAAELASFDEVDDDVDGGLASTIDLQ